MPPAGPVRAFLSYAHEDHAWRDAVLAHLGWLRHRGQLNLFDDRQIEPGTRWDPRIKAALEAADIVVLLLSPHFLNSRYCLVDELARAIERQREGSAELTVAFGLSLTCVSTDAAALFSALIDFRLRIASVSAEDG